MAYELSFSPEFFLAEGEPYDRSDLATNAKGQPISVWSAISSMSRKKWNDMAREVFGTTGARLQPELVLEEIERTNTCTDLRSPVEVWIDPEGFYTVKVYE